MNLPNFVNFGPFNDLRRKMRANKLGQFDCRKSEREDTDDLPPGGGASRRRKQAPRAAE